MKNRLLLAGILIMMLLSCRKDDNLPANDTRSFNMGVTPFPYDLGSEALTTSYNNALANSDMVLIHLDYGVPWQEALSGQPFPAEVNGTLAAAADMAVTHKIMLTATPISLSRDSLAGYWNDAGSHQPLPPPWNSYNFAHPEVIAAYLNYCRRIIDQIKPAYFAYGIEANGSFLPNTAIFEQFLILADTVYHTLKTEYPNLPVFLTLQDQSFNKNRQELLDMTAQLLPYTDMIAVSTYPFWLFDKPGQDANPDLLPSDWLDYMHNLAPDKPFGISETGYIAEDLDLHEIGINIKGTPDWQAAYATRLLGKANELDAQFVMWFVYRDYDMLYNRFPNAPFALRIWKDNGLEDGAGNKRPAHAIWQEWLAKEQNK